MTAGVCQRCGEAAPEITPELIAFGRTEYGNDFFPLCNPCTARELRANGWIGRGLPDSRRSCCR